MKKLVTLAAILALMMGVCAPAVAQVSQQTGQESESGDVKLNFSVTGSGNSASQCAPIVQGSQTGNLQNAQGVTQYASDSGDVGAEGSSGSVNPALTEQCKQTIQQSAAASGKAAPSPSAPPAPPKTIPSPTPPAPPKATPPAPPAEAKTVPPPSPTAPKIEENKMDKKELPKTGGSDSASLLGLGIGVLLVGGGLLVRKIV